jgi:ribonucleoside-diphosphate reductase alpha chain
MAVAGWEAALELAKRKGPGADHERGIRRHRRDAAQASGDGARRLEGRGDRSRASSCTPATAATCSASPRSRRSWSSARRQVGARFTHHTSIAPTGTISLSLANNASNGIEPSFAHHYFRNVIREGQEVEGEGRRLLVRAARLPRAGQPKSMPGSPRAEKLPDYFTTADDITPTEHVDIQAAAQKWVDSSISKTANVPTDYKYEDFKDIYSTPREGPEGLHHLPLQSRGLPGRAGEGRRPQEHHLRVHARGRHRVSVKGNEEIEYDGEKHSAANLYDALKEGYYGKF